MRVLHVTSEYPPLYFGGLGTSLAGLACAQVAAGVDVQVARVAGPQLYGYPYPYGAMNRNWNATRVQPGLNQYSERGVFIEASRTHDCSGVPVLDCNWPAHEAELLEFAVGWAPDAIHLHSSWLWPVAKAMRDCTRSRVVYTVHSLDSSEAAAGETLLHGHVQREAIEGADAVVALCQEESHLIAGQFPASKDRLHIVGNGVSTASGNRSAPARRNQDASVNILYAGRFATRKGVEDLFEAIPHVLNAGLDVQFVFAGGDSFSRGASGIEAAKAWLPPALNRHERSVSFKGWLNQRELTRCYENADVLVVPSRYEPFGMVVVEGMAHGLAVVAANTGGPAELIRHGESGLLFKPGDAQDLASALRTLAHDSQLRQALGQEASNWVRSQWSWDRIVAELERLYCQPTAS